MAERKATNKYIPSDFDPVKHRSVNKYRNSHPLRERARKLDQGILIIRFELPYNIWCGGCNNHVGMGVRYNAEKSKVGMYLTTPIYKFRMKCHLCDNHFEIQTDPANCDYVIVCGARRQENRWDPSENGQIVTEDKDDIKKMATDAMFKLEHDSEDLEKNKQMAPVIDKLQDFQDRWRDDFSANQQLRKNLRTQKSKDKTEKDKDDALLKKLSIGVKLLPESSYDVKLSSLIRLEPTETFQERKESTRNRIVTESIFKSSEESKSNSNLNKQFIEIAKSLAIKKVEEEDISLDEKKLGISLIKPIAGSSQSTIKSLVPYASDQSDSD